MKEGKEERGVMGQQGFMVRGGKAIVIAGAVVVVVVVLVAWWLVGSKTPSGKSPAQVASKGQGTSSVPGQVVATDRVPACLVQMGTESATLYEMVRAQNWQQVSNKLTSIRAAAKRLPVEVKKDAVDEPQLLHVLNDLDQAAAKKDQLMTMRLANEVTFIAARLSAPFEPQIPVEVSLLDYFGRELEIWSAMQDTTKLTLTADEIRDTWGQLRPLAEKQDGNAEVNALDELVTRIQAAKTSEVYGQLAVPFLSQVDKIEKLFLN